MEQNKRDNLTAIFLSVILAYLTYLVVISELPQTLSDYNGHTYVYLPMFSKENWIQGWMAVPYCMWHLGVMGLNHFLHIPLEASAAYMSCFFSLFSYYVIYWAIRRLTAHYGMEESSSKAGMIAFGLCVVQAFYFYWLDAGGRFLGSYSMNPIHNPTHMAVRPFSVICFCLVCDIWGRQKDESYRGIFFSVERGLKKYYILLTIMLLLSTMAKPTFAEMFIPAVGFCMLGEWIKRIQRKDGSAAGYFKHCINTLLCAVPSLLYILLQFLSYFIWGGSYGADGSLMVTKWLEVWSMYSENVVLSIGLGMAFPLFLFLIDIRFFLKDDMGRLALVGYGVGFLEAALLGEEGAKLSYGNFIWPMMSGMLLMWIASTMHLLVLERSQADTKGKRILLSMAWVLFCFHVLCGLIYIKSMITV